MKYNGLDWSDTLLDGGVSKTQEQWVVWCKENGWRLPSVKDYESLLGCKGKFMDDLEEEFDKYWLMTADTLTSPFNGFERPVVLGDYAYYRFGIDASSGNFGRPARGVRVRGSVRK